MKTKIGFKEWGDRILALETTDSEALKLWALFAGNSKLLTQYPAQITKEVNRVSVRLLTIGTNKQSSFWRVQKDLKLINVRVTKVDYNDLYELVPNS